MIVNNNVCMCVRVFVCFCCVSCKCLIIKVCFVLEGLLLWPVMMLHAR